MGGSKRKKSGYRTEKQKRAYAEAQAYIEMRALLHFPKTGVVETLPQKGMKVWSRDKKLIGHMTGGYRLCQLESCGGRAVGVRWPGKKITFPCTKGLEVYKDGMKIM